MTQSVVVESSLPGVTALVNVSQVASPVQRQPTSTFMVVGYSPWGPVNTPTVVTSWNDYVRQFGPLDDNSFSDDAIYAFFNLFQGAQAIVNRVVGATPVVGTLTLKDKSGAGGVNTIRVDALFPSTRVDISVQVAAGTAANAYKLIITSVLLNRSETFDNLLIGASYITQVNQSSKLIKLTDLASVTAAPNNIPTVLAATPLAGGTDDFAHLAVADHIGVDSGTTKTGLQSFNDSSFGTGQVAIPGMTTTAVHNALVAHAEAYHRLALIDPPLGSAKSDVATLRALHGTPNAAVYWPWVEMLGFSGSGQTKFYPPSGFVAGACAQVDRTVGTGKAPANIAIPGALDVERFSNGQSQVDDNTRAFLNGLDCNVIVPLPNQGVKIYGARVMAGADRRVSMVHEVRLLNLFYYSALQAYAWAPFQTVDGQGRLFRDLVSTGSAFLRGFYQAGALFGDKESDAFIVVADSSNNPPESLALGQVHVEWGVKLSPTAETIFVNIDNVPVSSDLSVLQ